MNLMEMDETELQTKLLIVYESSSCLYASKAVNELSYKLCRCQFLTESAVVDAYLFWSRDSKGHISFVQKAPTE